MRSEYVFAAAKEISNRFLLCRITSVSSRRLHLDSRQPADTINKSLNLIAAGELNKNHDDGRDQSSLLHAQVATESHPLNDRLTTPEIPDSLK